MCPAHTILSEICFLWTRKPTAAEGPHLEQQKGKAEKKKRINPFLRKISGCPFRVGCGWSSHIFLCQWLDPRCIAFLPWAACCTALCSSHPASLPILHRLYGDLLRRDKEIPLFLWHGAGDQSRTALCDFTNVKKMILGWKNRLRLLISNQELVMSQGRGRDNILKTFF